MGRREIRGRKADVGSFFGADMPLAVRFLLAFLIVLGLICADCLGGSPVRCRSAGGAGTRGRQPRTAVVDDASVHSRRRLILVRRDNIEHLVLIGGPTDVVVEADIVRAAPATREASLTRPPPAAETLPRAPPLPENGNGSWPLRPEPMGPPRPAPRMEPDEQVNWPLPQYGEAPPRPARETLAATAEEIAARPVPAIVSKAPLGLVQSNHEGSRAANDVPKLEQSRAGCRYNRIRRRVAAADQNLAAMAHRLEAALRMPKMVADAGGEGRAPPPVAPPAPAPENGVDAAAAEAGQSRRAKLGATTIRCHERRC